MKLRTFLLTYLLFLAVLFTSLGVVSAYMTSSQINLLQDKSIREYQTIVTALSRDIDAIYSSARQDGLAIAGPINTLMRGYTHYYSRHNIDIELTRTDHLGTFDNLNAYDTTHDNIEALFVEHDQSYFITVSESLPPPLDNYQLDFHADITEEVRAMRHISNILLGIAIGFSLIAAFALYFILSKVFRPLEVVAEASQKIADGQYHERIEIKGSDELSSVAHDFNKMAEATERQMRLLREEAEAKQQFIDNFAHEMRTPLTSIYGYAEYVQKAPLDADEIIESTNYIMNEAGHLEQVSNSLLRLATLRNYTPELETVAVKELFDEVSVRLKKPLAVKGTQLSTTVGADIKLIGERDLLKSLLVNLSLNAIEACDEAGGSITLEARQKDATTVLIVTDNGRGISAQDLPKVTDPFFRVDRARSRKTGGAGIGLSLCKQIVEAHGASMEIESELEAGTKITITFTHP